MLFAIYLILAILSYLLIGYLVARWAHFIEPLTTWFLVALFVLVWPIAIWFVFVADMLSQESNSVGAIDKFLMKRGKHD